MIIDTRVIEKVLESKLTGYRVRGLVDITQPAYDNYKFGRSTIDNMPIRTAKEIMKLYQMRGEWK